jgi:hypothetical protein
VREEAQTDSRMEMEMEERRAAAASCGMLNTHYSFFAVLLAKVFVLLCLPDLSPASHNGVAILKGSLKPRHLPLPASREVAGIRL